MPLHDARHPVYPLATFGIVCLTLVGLSLGTAERFNANEIVTIVGALGALAGGLVVQRAMTRAKEA